MESKSPIPPRFQFTIAGGMLILTAIAAVLALGNWWSERGGLSIAIPVCIIPFAILVEFAFRSPAKNEMPALTQMLARLSLVLILSALPGLSAWVGLYDQSSWWSPCPLLVFLLYAYMESWLQNWPYAIYFVPAATFLILAFPVVTTSEIRYLPIRSLTVLVVATATSIYWFWSSFSIAFEYQTASYIFMAIFANALIAVLLWGAWMILRRRFNATYVLTWNLVLCCWLFWLAYPWLGDYI